jgi:TolA-binding protein
MKKLNVLLMAGFACAAALADVPGSITTETGETHKGQIRWSVRDKAYVVTKGNVELQVLETDVADLDIEKPAGFDQAVEKVQKGQGAAAIPALQKIVKGYQRLQWDKTAGRYLAEAYVDAGKAEEGLKACQSIISGDPSAAYRGALAPAYWKALLALNRTSALERALEKAAKSGDRASSGAALILRGDIIMKAGNESVDAAKKALTDGYLRVVYLYTDADVAALLQPEALYKASRCFEKLGQSGRAEAMRAELKKFYASSPWAAK